MSQFRKRAFIQLAGWVGALCLFGALLYAVAPRLGVIEPIQRALVDLSAASSPPVVDPCSQAVTADSSVARIDYYDDEALRALIDRVDIWEVDQGLQRVVALVTPAEREWLLRANYPFSVDADLTAALPDPCAFQLQADSGIPGYACYRTVEETYADLSSLAAQYPHLAEWTDIGNSWDKTRILGLAGHDIHALVLTNQENSDIEKGELVVMAAIHARELVTAELATRFAELLLSEYGSDPDLTWLLDYNRIHIIPQANPDGRRWAEKGYLWRKNTNNPDACDFPYYGVDLNRNGSFLWNHCEGCSSGDMCSVFNRGGASASEPETRAIEAYLRAVFSDQRGENYDDPAAEDTNGVFISLHAYGRLLLYPWEHSSYLAPNRDALRRLGRKLGYAPGYKVCNPEICMYRFDGSTTDYAYGTLGVASYTYEIGTAFFQDCAYFESSIVEDNLDSLVYAAKAARRPYQLPAGPDVTIATTYPRRAAQGATVTLRAVADDTRSAGSGSDREPAQPISAARFSVGAPSWLTTPAGTLQPLDGTFAATVEFLTGSLDTSELQPGTHTVFLEAQDADGNWGPPTAIYIEIAAPGADGTPPGTPPPNGTPTPTPTLHSLYLPNVWR